MRLLRHGVELSELYRDPEWRRTRELVLARDGYRCQASVGEHAGSLSVHHLRPLRHGGSLLDEHNLVTVCRRHHDELESATRRSELEIHLSGLAWLAHRIEAVAQARGETAVAWVERTLTEAVEVEFAPIAAAGNARMREIIRFIDEVNEFFESAGKEA